MSRLIYLFTLLLEIVTTLINKYNEAQQRKKYEAANSNSTNQWVTGFGVRQETKADPTKTDTK